MVRRCRRYGVAGGTALQAVRTLPHATVSCLLTRKQKNMKLTFGFDCPFVCVCVFIPSHVNVGSFFTSSIRAAEYTAVNTDDMVVEVFKHFEKFSHISNKGQQDILQ